VADDRILGFAMYLLKEKMVQGTVVFVTEDKMLRLKARGEKVTTAAVEDLFVPNPMGRNAPKAGGSDDNDDTRLPSSSPSGSSSDGSSYSSYNSASSYSSRDRRRRCWST